MLGPLWSLLCFCLLASIASSQHQQSLDYFLLQERQKERETIGQRDVVLLVGRPDVGINAFSKFIRHDQWSEVIDYDTEPIHEEAYNRSNETNQTSEYLNYNIDEKSGHVIVEYPCQVDSSPNLDLISKVQIENVLDSANRIKIIMMEKYQNLLLNDALHNFLALLRCVANLIKTNINSFHGAIGLLFTEINISDEGSAEYLQMIKEFVTKARGVLIEEHVKAISKGNIETVDILQIQLQITYFLIDGKHFGITYEPDKIGSPGYSTSLQLNYALGRDIMFERVNFSSPFIEKFSVKVAPKTLEHIKENLIPTTKHEVSTQFSILIDFLHSHIDSKTYIRPYKSNLKAVVRYYEHTLDQLASVKRAEELEYYIRTADINQTFWRNITHQTSKLQLLYRAAGKTGFEAEVADMFGMKNTLLQQIEENRNFNDFCRRLVTDLDTYLVQSMDASLKLQFLNASQGTFDSWKKLLVVAGFQQETAIAADKFVVDTRKAEKILELATDFIGRPASLRVESEVATIVSEYLILSHLADKLQRDDTIHEIALIATNRIFIDCDLFLLGKDLTIVSPVIESVDMKSKKATKDESLEAKQVTGVEKEEVNSLIARNLKILTLHIKNSHLLMVNSVSNARTDATDMYSRRIKHSKFGKQMDSDGQEHIAKLRMYNSDEFMGTTEVNMEYYGMTEGFKSAITVDSDEVETDGKFQFYNFRNHTAIANLTSSLEGRSATNGSKYGINEVIKDICTFVIKIPIPLSEQNETLAFLESFVTNNETLELLDLNNYVEFLSLFDSFMQESSQLHNIELVYNILYRSFCLFGSSCNRCNTLRLEEVNLLFISRLSYIRTFSIQKQITNLPFAAKALSKQFSKIKDSLRDISIFNTVEREVRAARKQIIKAVEMIEEAQQENMSDMKEKIDGKLDELLQKGKEFQNMYQVNIGTLERHQESVKDAIVVKAVFGTFNVMAQVAGLFYPPASFIGDTINSIGNHFSKTEDVDVKAMMANAPKGLENAAGVIAEYKKMRRRDNEYRKIEQMKALKLVLETEASTGKTIIVDEEQRKQVTDMVEQYNSYVLQSKNSPVEFVVTISSNILKSVDSNLDDMIKQLKGSNIAEEKISGLKTASKQVKLGLQVLKVASSVIDVMNAYKEGEAELRLIATAIESNKVALQEIARYEKVVENEFIPMLEDMLENFNEIQSGLKDSNIVMLQLRKIDVKKLARRFAALIQQFTKDFVKEGEGIDSVFVEMEEYMTLIIDSYDKLNELEYRVQLKEFMGRVSGGECARDEDPLMCTRNQGLATQILIDEMLRSYLTILSAYQQSMFPHGGAQIVEFQKTFKLLKENPSIAQEDKVNVLQESLQSIIDALTTMDNTEISTIDSAMHTPFISSTRPFKPFFTWPNAKYFKQIQNLLKGELVTLSASVFSPGVKNAVKFEWVILNFTSSDPLVTRIVQQLLVHFEVKMVHLGESHYRCGENFYVIGGNKLEFRHCYENTVCGLSICNNAVFDKMKSGDVPFSPYTVWNFQLIHISSRDKQSLYNELQGYAQFLDLQLEGSGYYTPERDQICKTDLGRYFQYYNGPI